MSRNSAPLDIDKETFRQIGYQLVDTVTDHFDQLRQKQVTQGKPPSEIRRSLGQGSMPEEGTSPEEIVKRATDLLMHNSLLDGHPGFWGYIIGSGTQIGVLADMLAAAVNPNVGGWELSPMAAEIERQTVQWIAEWVDYPAGAGGLLVSGGAMANYVGFLCAKTVKADWDIRKHGYASSEANNQKVYCSAETHTWIQKAADLFGLGTDAIEWIPSDSSQRMDMDVLEQRLARDIADGYKPFLLVGTAGTVSTGAVDDLRKVAEIARRYDMWFHVDGAYGGPAAYLEECRELFDGFNEADSIALDPHKWFYSPQEAGCALVKNPQHLLDTFSYRPPYYHLQEFDVEPSINYYEFGMQNSRGFRALKVWMGFMQAGRRGMSEMISHDIAMAKLLFDLVDAAEDFDAFQTSLSITTFQYVPDRQMPQDQINTLNRLLMVEIQNQGQVFVSNAVIDGKYLMRACIVNFRTAEEDIQRFPELCRHTYDDARDRILEAIAKGE